MCVQIVWLWNIRTTFIELFQGEVIMENQSEQDIWVYLSYSVALLIHLAFMILHLTCHVKAKTKEITNIAIILR